MYDSNRSRREFLKQLGWSSLLLGSSSILGACDWGSDRSIPQKLLRFYGTGTLDVLEAGWKHMEEATGIEIRFTDNGNDTGPVIAQMITGTASRDYDLGGLQGGAEKELADSGVILPWSVSKISNWNMMWEMALDIPYTIVNGEQYGIPLALNADSMIYLPDRIREFDGYETGVVNSYFAVFDERLKGRTSMEDAWINSAIFAAIYLKGSGESIGDPGNLTESELKNVMSFLIDLKKKGQFRKFWRGWEQGVDLLASGEVWVMTGWEPIVYELRRRGIVAEYAVPREGYEGWSNDLLLHAGTEKKGLIEVAHQAADWLLSGYYGCRLAALRGYAVPNETSVSFAKGNGEFEAGEVERLTEHVKGKFEIGGGETYWQNVRPDNYRLYEEWWSRLRNA